MVLSYQKLISVVPTKLQLFPLMATFGRKIYTQYAEKVKIVSQKFERPMAFNRNAFDKKENTKLAESAHPWPRLG